VALSSIPGSGLLFGALLAVVAIEYGNLASRIPGIKALRLSTLLAWLVFVIVVVRVGPAAIRQFRQSQLLFTLVLFTGVSVLWAVVRSYVPDVFRYMMDYFGLFVVTAFLIDRPSRIRWLARVIALAVVYLVDQNLDKLASTVRAGALNAAYFMGDGNDFAWGLLSLLPFPLYLMLGRNWIGDRALGLLAVVASLMAIIGTQSRGATLALVAAVLYYWIVLARRRVLSAAAIGLALTAVLMFAPASYFDRLQTIESYEEDSSAQGRIRAWKASLQMARDFPLGVGAGNFNSAYGRYYIPDDAEGWASRRWISAHSVYFKVLGEYGVIGLAIFLFVLATNLRDNHRSIQRFRAHSGSVGIPELWPALLNLGLVAYAVAGMFLGGLTYPHLFVLSGLTVACKRQAAVAATSPTTYGVRGDSPIRTGQDSLDVGLRARRLADARAQLTMRRQRPSVTAGRG
jgi:probable O-glycosylation ligase (exosortase A-associated)